MQASIANDRFVTISMSSIWKGTENIRWQFLWWRNSNTCLARTNMGLVKIMLLQNGHNISPAKQIVYSCLKLMFENIQFCDFHEKYSGAMLSTTLCWPFFYLLAKDLCFNQCWFLGAVPWEITENRNGLWGNWDNPSRWFLSCLSPRFLVASALIYMALLLS